MSALRDFLLAPPDGAVLEPPATASGASAARPRRRVARSAAAAAAARRVPRAAAVLCAAEDAPAVGVAAAALLARRARAACGLALVWRGSGASPRPEAGPRGARAARRLAAAIGARDIPAVACARTVQVALPEAPEEALAVARRAAAAAGDTPVVVVLGGPRPEAFDAVLAEQDRLLVLTRPGVDDAVAALAVAGLPGDAVARSVALGPAARALARAGIAVPAGLRRALTPLAEEDPARGAGAPHGAAAH
jgi:hypothetical protein